MDRRRSATTAAAVVLGVAVALGSSAATPAVGKIKPKLVTVTTRPRALTVRSYRLTISGDYAYVGQRPQVVIHGDITIADVSVTVMSRGTDIISVEGNGKASVTGEYGIRDPEATCIAAGTITFPVRVGMPTVAPPPEDFLPPDPKAPVPQAPAADDELAPLIPRPPKAAPGYVAFSLYEDAVPPNGPTQTCDDGFPMVFYSHPAWIVLNGDMATSLLEEFPIKGGTIKSEGTVASLKFHFRTSLIQHK